MTDTEIEIMVEAYDDFKAVIMPRTRKTTRELGADTPESFKRASRVEYLKECMTERIVETWGLIARYEEYQRTDRVLERLLTGEEIQSLVRGILSLQAEILSLRGFEKVATGMTEEAIRRAREYRFTNLLEFRRNQARCPFHEDKSPSMHLYGAENRVHCFSCGRGWDTISFLMDRDGVSFQDAVKGLQ